MKAILRDNIFQIVFGSIMLLFGGYITIHVRIMDAREIKRQFEQCKINAETGEIAAQLYLADCYANGRCVERNKAESVKWLRKAADGGNAYAQGKLGECYFCGYGVEKNAVEGERWCWMALANGFAYGGIPLVAEYFDSGIERKKITANAILRKMDEADLVMDLSKNKIVKASDVNRYPYYTVEWHRGKTMLKLVSGRYGLTRGAFNDQFRDISGKTVVIPGIISKVGYLVENDARTFMLIENFGTCIRFVVTEAMRPALARKKKGDLVTLRGEVLPLRGQDLEPIVDRTEMIE